MTEQLPPIAIARRDHARLERLADDALRARHPVGRLLMSEIRRAVVFDTNRAPEGVACLNQWVTYKVDGSRQSESKVLGLSRRAEKRSNRTVSTLAAGCCRSRNEHWPLHKILQYRGWTSLRGCRGRHRPGGCAPAFSAGTSPRGRPSYHRLSRARWRRPSGSLRADVLETSSVTR